MFELLKRTLTKRIDWFLVVAVLLILIAGLLTMNSFTATSYFSHRQLWWAFMSLLGFLLASLVDWRFLRQSGVLVSIYGLSCVVLILVSVVGRVVKGAQSWFDLGGIALQPSDFFKLVLILMLAKYFSRRHIEIAHWRHILVSGLYAFIPFALILLQPDLGSAVIIFLIWLGMIIFSGVSRKHLLTVLAIGLVGFSLAWVFAFAPYQKDRIMTFLHPLADIRGAGYNSFQSTVAIGSGQFLGKGVGYGTQSRLQFLPEYETDFIFAAFAEEWGLVGVLFLFALFGIIIWRVTKISLTVETNFEALFGIGLAILIISQFIINVGMNIGLLPVTGLTLPFMSYGGSHLLSEFIGLGMLMGMRGYNRGFHRDDMKNEFLGLE